MDSIPPDRPAAGSGLLTGCDWDSRLAQCGDEGRDVYFTRTYHELHPETGTAECFCHWQGRQQLLVPGLRVPLPAPVGAAGWSDLQSCNGYGGPAASPDPDAEFLREAWAEWKRHCRAARVVAAFFRLHPLAGNERLMPADAAVKEDRSTVFLPLEQGLDEVWRNASSNYRNMVNKGRRLGTKVHWNRPGDWDAFPGFYLDAMARLAAPAALRFGEEYFRAVRQLPGTELAAVWEGDRPAAMSIFLHGPQWSHYHLSARHPESQNHVLTVILHAAVERAFQRQSRGIHLGGGRTAQPDDGLLKFKASTGGRLLRFKTALVVADPTAFASLVAGWRQQHGRDPVWMLGYRQP